MRKLSPLIASGFLAVALLAAGLPATRAQTQISTPPGADAVPRPSYAGGGCLSAAEGRRVLQGANAVSLADAARAARATTPGEIIDYKICSSAGAYSYVLTILAGNGKVSRAWVDATSGKLLAVR